MILEINTKMSVSVVAAFFVACSGGAGFDSKTGTRKGDSKPELTETEEDKADIPEEVSGSFLTCAWQSQESTIEDHVVVGCRLPDPDGGRYAPEEHDFGLTTIVDGDRGDLTSSKPVPANQWDVYGDFPRTLIDSDGELEMSVIENSGEVIAVEVIAISDIAGTLAPGTALKPLTRFAVAKKWAYVQDGMNILKMSDFFNDGLAGGDFCDGNGPRDQFKTGSAIATALGNVLKDSLLGGLTGPKDDKVNSNIQSASDQFTIESPSCFKQVDINGSTDVDNWVHALPKDGPVTCYAFADDEFVYIVDANNAGEEGHLSLDNFAQFIAKSNSCN